MKRRRWRTVAAIGLVCLLGVGLIGARVWLGRARSLAERADQRAVTRLVEEFGKRLQMVSLLAPADALARSMNEQYGSLVTPQLIEKWLAEPLLAPGRLTSSPWPERIEIACIAKTAPEAYAVEGTVVELTSVEKESGGAASASALRRSAGAG